MKLSVALATHNEERNIVRTLESVYNWVDEIVMVDGESTDKTVEVIKKFDNDGKIKIFEEKNPPMFHENKQKALEKCTCDWILQLDADEIVTTELRDEIRSVVNSKKQDTSSKQISNFKFQISNSQPSVAVAYWIPRLNYFLGRPLRKGGQYPDYTIRLYKRGVAKFPCKSVHEQVEVRRTEILNKVKDGVRRTEILSGAKDTEIGRLKSDLLHYPYPTFDAYLDKWARYSLLEAQVLKDKGVRPSWTNFIKYMIVYPKLWFFKTYFRHRGYVDGFPGFVFSLFSSLRYWITYVKLYELSSKN